MKKTLVILGSGFDIDLGLNNSYSNFHNSHFNPFIFGNDKKWEDFEKTLRNEVKKWYYDGKNKQEAEELYKLKEDFSKNISWFFTYCSDKFEINKETCAYRFLESITETSKIYSFNYTNPYEYVDINQTNEIIHLHGRYYKDSFKKRRMVISQGRNIILGIDDNCIPKDGFNNHHIHTLVKKNHNIYKETDIIKDLSNVENVVFYGFSMGIVDFNYFENFFSSIIDGTYNCKNIFYITYNKDSYDDFCRNLLNVNVDYKVIAKKVSLNPIYTINGREDKEFINMLRVI